MGKWCLMVLLLSDVLCFKGGNCPLGANVDDSDDEFDPVNVQPDNELEKVGMYVFCVHICVYLCV